MIEHPRLPTLAILPVSKVARHLLSKSRGHTFRCIVSIGEPGEKLPTGFRRVPARLRLEFADIVDAREQGVLPTDSDIERLIEFARVVAATDGATIVHCQAGISRSTAAALILLTTILGPGSEAAALDEVVRLVPSASPNALMVRLADALLKRSGALVAAVSARTS